MAEIINLRGARKAKARQEARATGDVNAARFGRSKAEKALQAARAEKAARDLNGHERGQRQDGGGRESDGVGPE